MSPYSVWKTRKSAIVFEDLCTINEIKSLAQRLEVAIMLRNKYTYQEIAEKTGASTATISKSQSIIDIWFRWLPSNFRQT